MAVISPTKTAVRWGPERWQVFDYYAHPTRDQDTGNPCLIYRHGGGGWTSSYKEPWPDAATLRPLIDYLHSNSRTTHFDIISIETAQRGYTDAVDAVSGIRPTKLAWLPDQITDLKRGICAIKRWGVGVDNDTGFRINPFKLILCGNSHGGLLAGLATMTAPLLGHGAQYSYLHRLWEPKGYDSTTRGVILSGAQVDCRNIGGTDYIGFANTYAWFGTRYDLNTEWNALSSHMKTSMSIRAYFENGDTSFYTPMFTLYGETGAHTYPLSDPHDSVQRTDLNTAIANAKLPYDSYLYTSTSDAAMHAAVYNWMVSRITADGLGELQATPV